MKPQNRIIDESFKKTVNIEIMDLTVDWRPLDE